MGLRTLLALGLPQLRDLGTSDKSWHKKGILTTSASGSLPAGSGGSESSESPFPVLNFDYQEKIFVCISSLGIVTLVKIRYGYSCFLLIPFLPRGHSFSLCLPFVPFVIRSIG